MKVFYDILSGEEVFSDSYKVRDEGEDDFLIAVEGKMITRKTQEGISADLIGGNPSQEEQEEELDDGAEVKSGIDVVLDHQLVEVNLGKKEMAVVFKLWAKNFCKTIEDKEKEECFKNKCQKHFKTQYLNKINEDVSLFAAKNFDVGAANGAVLIGVWHDDGIHVTLYGIKDAFRGEKV